MIRETLELMRSGVNYIYFKFVFSPHCVKYVGGILFSFIFLWEGFVIQALSFKNVIV